MAGPAQRQGPRRIQMHTRAQPTTKTTEREKLLSIDTMARTRRKKTRILYFRDGGHSLHIGSTHVAPSVAFLKLPGAPLLLPVDSLFASIRGQCGTMARPNGSLTKLKIKSQLSPHGLDCHTHKGSEKPRKHLESPYSWVLFPLYDVSRAPYYNARVTVPCVRSVPLFFSHGPTPSSSKMHHNGVHARQTMLQWHNCDLERASHSAVRHCDAAATRLICHSGNVGELMSTPLS